MLFLSTRATRAMRPGFKVRFHIFRVLTCRRPPAAGGNEPRRNRDLQGDFDLQVDYQLLTWPHANGVRVGLVVMDGAGHNVTTERTSFGDPGLDFPSWPREVYLNNFIGSAGVLGITATGDQAGTLRVVRSAGMATGYYRSGGSWVPIASAPTAAADMRFRLAAFSREPFFSGQLVRAAFDNVVVNHGQLVCPPIPILASVDIKPGSDPNSINLRSRGVVPVAVLGGRAARPDGAPVTIDATRLNPESMRIMDAADFNPQDPARRFPHGAQPVRSALEDVNGDGHLDLVLFFRTPDLAQQGLFDGNTTGARVFGPAGPGGQPITGTDAVNVVPPPSRGRKP